LKIEIPDFHNISMSNFVYLVRSQEHIDLNEPTYSIIKVTRTPKEVAYGCFAECEIVLSKRCYGSHVMCEKLIKMFRSIFVCRDTFTGNEDNM